MCGVIASHCRLQLQLILQLITKLGLRPHLDSAVLRLVVCLGATAPLWSLLLATSWPHVLFPFSVLSSCCSWHPAGLVPALSAASSWHLWWCKEAQPKASHTCFCQSGPAWPKCLMPISMPSTVFPSSWLLLCAFVERRPKCLPPLLWATACSVRLTIAATC